MARLLFVHDRSGPTEEPVDVERALRWMRAVACDPTRVEALRTPDGQGSLWVLCRQSESGRVWQDSRWLVALEGAARHGAQLLDAERFGVLCRKHGVANAAALCDGSWCAIVAEGHTVSAVRDRLGVKPLYVRQAAGTLALASNAGALALASRSVARAHLPAIARYAASHYSIVYGRSDSFFAGIALLEPATCLTWKEGRIRRECYFALDPSATFARGSDEEWAERYRATLLESCRASARAAVRRPVAVALSGGIDSGSVAGALHAATGERQSAISLTYPEETDFNEKKLIDCSVRDHVAIWHDVKTDGAALAAELETLYQRFDLPLATVSLYGYDALYRSARQLGFQTLFTGTGADQVQAGNYPAFLYHLADLHVAADQRAYERELAGWIERQSTLAYPKDRGVAERFFTTAVDLRHPGRLLPRPVPLAPGILSPELTLDECELARRVVEPHSTYLRAFTLQEYRYEALAAVVEADDLIEWTYAVDTVAPYGSLDFLKLGWEMPSDQKIRDGINKSLARRALRGVCADEVLDHVQKTGFNAPLDQWLRGALRPLAEELLGSTQLRQRGLYDLARLDASWQEHLDGRKNHMMLFWQVLNLELWSRAWIDG